MASVLNDGIGFPLNQFDANSLCINIVRSTVNAKLEEFHINSNVDGMRVPL